MAGVELSTMVPVIAAIAFAVGGGVLVWREWTSATRAAEKAAKDLHEEMEGIAKTVSQLRDLQKAGLLSPAAAKKNLDLLTGKTKLYKSAEDGNLTTSPTSMVPRFATVVAPKSSPNDPTVEIQQRVMKQVQNQLATAAEVQKYINDQLNVPGALDQNEIAAKNKVQDLRNKIHQESLSDIEQEKEKIHDKYEAERQDIEDVSKSMGKLLTPGQESQNKAAIAQSTQSEERAKQAIDLKAREEELAKADAAFIEGQRLTALQVRKENEDLERDLSLSAVRQWRTREQIYEEEFAKRKLLLTQQLYSGEITEEQFTDAFKEATTKRLNAAMNEEHTIEAIRNKLALAGTSDLKRQEVEINQRYDAEIKAVEKLNISLEKQLQLIKEIEKARNADLEKAKTDADLKADKEAEQFQSITMGFRKMFGIRQNLTKEQQQTEDRIDAEREQAVYNMLGNIATAAKAYGEKGLAVYKAFGIAQATIDTAKAAIAAYNSVVGIPYVGPVLAVAAAGAAVAAGAAQIANIENASAREHGGEVQPGMPYRVGERGEEIIVPNESARVFNADDTARLVNLTRTSASGRSAPSGSPKISVNFFSDGDAMNKHARENADFHHIMVDVFRKNVHLVPARANA